MAWQQQLQNVKDSITWDAVKEGWSSTWFQGSPGGQTAQPADYMGVLVLTLAFPVVRYALHKAVFQPVGRYMIAGSAFQKSGQRLPDKTRSKIDKFCESFWKLLVYGAFSYMTFAAAVDEPWFKDTSYFWRGYPNHPLSPQLARAYCLEMASYLSGVGMLVFWETRRKDFWVMMTHHFATIILIGLSYHLNFTRVGCMILLLHDVCDVLMEAAKMCKYCGQELMSSVIFGLFMLMWMVMRLIYFPIWVIWSTSIESTEVLGKPVPHYYLFNGLLSLLAVLHAYWFSLDRKSVV